MSPGILVASPPFWLTPLPADPFPCDKIEKPEFVCAGRVRLASRGPFPPHLSASKISQGALSMAIPATQMRPGMIIKHNN
ncbi:MAG TPA: hypothetical protein VMD92_06870, partial [Acidobacteriaceae bacterium]|nr:hypothetical protein [Acidobacteriaceae bacterium]